MKEINFNTMEDYMKDHDKYENFKMDGFKYIHDRYGILAVLGLFIPVPTSQYSSIFKNSKYGWILTITIGGVPLGWIMIIVAIIF